MIAQGQAATLLPSPEEIERVCAMEDPILRNLKITYNYYLLSRALQTFLQDPNINWCTFASWASLQAGVSIRKEELSRLLYALWEGENVKQVLVTTHPGILDVIEEHVLLPVLTDAVKLVKETDLRRIIDKSMNDVSAAIALGNLRVFQELAPHFVRLMSSYRDDVALDPKKLADFVAVFNPGPVEADGQDMLRNAFGQYIEARFETDAKRKAERILLANGQVGLHEQTRLQPQIKTALDVPVDDIESVIEGMMGQLHLRLPVPLPGDIAGGLANGVQELWRKEATHHLMSLNLAGKPLRLGDPLPPLNGQGLYPKALMTLEEIELLAFMHKYDPAWDHDPRNWAPGTPDWADLNERMVYIICLFRSRQQDLGLYTPPFAPAQIEAILADQVPGDL